MKKHFETFQDFIESLNSKFSAIYLSETYNHSSWQEDWTLGYHSIKFKHIFLSGFSFTDTNDSQNSRGRGWDYLYSTLPFPPAHEYSGIYLI